MRTIRILAWLIIAGVYITYSVVHPEQDNAARSASVIALAVVEGFVRIKRRIDRNTDDNPIAPEPIQSLNLTKRPPQ
jgi:hypothetical protein